MLIINYLNYVSNIPRVTIHKDRSMKTFGTAIPTIHFSTSMRPSRGCNTSSALKTFLQPSLIHKFLSRSQNHASSANLAPFQTSFWISQASFPFIQSSFSAGLAVILEHVLVLSPKLNFAVQSKIIILNGSCFSTEATLFSCSLHNALVLLMCHIQASINEHHHSLHP